MEEKIKKEGKLQLLIYSKKFLLNKRILIKIINLSSN